MYVDRRERLTKVNELSRKDSIKWIELHFHFRDNKGKPRRDPILNILTTMNRLSFESRYLHPKKILPQFGISVAEYIQAH